MLCCLTKISCLVDIVKWPKKPIGQKMLYIPSKENFALQKGLGPNFKTRFAMIFQMYR